MYAGPKVEYKPQAMNLERTTLDWVVDAPNFVDLEMTDLDVAGSWTVNEMLYGGSSVVYQIH